MSDDACGCTCEAVLLPSNSQLLYVCMSEDGKLSTKRVSCRYVGEMLIPQTEEFHGINKILYKVCGRILKNSETHNYLASQGYQILMDQRMQCCIQ